MSSCCRFESLPRKRLGELELRKLPTYGKLAKVSCYHVTIPAHGTHAAVVHRRTDELTHVVRGSGLGFVGGRKFRVAQGDAIRIPAGTVHAFRAGSRGLEFVCLFAPAMNPASPDMEEVAARLPW